MTPTTLWSCKGAGRALGTSVTPEEALNRSFISQIVFLLYSFKSICGHNPCRILNSIYPLFISPLLRRSHYQQALRDFTSILEKWWVLLQLSFPWLISENLQHSTLTHPSPTMNMYFLCLYLITNSKRSLLWQTRRAGGSAAQRQWSPQLQPPAPIIRKTSDAQQAAILMCFHHAASSSLI